MVFITLRMKIIETRLSLWGKSHVSTEKPGLCANPWSSTWCSGGNGDAAAGTGDAAGVPSLDMMRSNRAGCQGISCQPVICWNLVINQTVRFGRNLLSSDQFDGTWSQSSVVKHQYVWWRMITCYKGRLRMFIVQKTNTLDSKCDFRSTLAQQHEWKGLKMFVALIVTEFRWVI